MGESMEGKMKERNETGSSERWRVGRRGCIGQIEGERNRKRGERRNAEAD
jgi:hypothetical protein